MICAPGPQGGRGRGVLRSVDGPERALVGGVVTDGEVLAVGEGGGAGGGEKEENKFVHNKSIGCLKQNMRSIGLGIFQDEETDRGIGVGGNVLDEWRQTLLRLSVEAPVGGVAGFEGLFEQTGADQFDRHRAVLEDGVVEGFFGHLAAFD